MKTIQRIVACSLAFALILAAATACALVQPYEKASYELRQKNASSAARLLQAGEAYQRTSINYVSLDNPIRIAMADATQSGMGTAVELSYTTANKGRETKQYLAKCESLTLTSSFWPALAVDGTYTLPMLINGGSLSDLTIEGGQITIRNATLTGTVSVRGQATVAFENCSFAQGAVLSTSGTPTVTVNGAAVQ